MSIGADRFLDLASPGVRVLNFGCGRRKRPGEIGVDVGALADADVRVGASGPLPFRDATFDAVVSRYTLEHVAALDSVLSEIHRVLKPGGIFRFTVPHCLSLDAYDDPTHVRFFSLRTIRHLTGEADVHYASARFSACRVRLCLMLAWPRWKPIRWPANLLLGTLSSLAPDFCEQLLKLPFTSGTIMAELRKENLSG